MSRRLAFLSIAAAALVLASSADARVRCQFYDTRFPSMSELRGSNVGCTSVRSVADAIKDAWEDGDEFTREVEAVDRTWRCSYRERQGETNPYYKAICVSGRCTVGIVLGS